MSDGATRPGSVGPDSTCAPGAQRSQSGTLPAPKLITNGSAPSVFDLTLENLTEQVVVFWLSPSCFSQWFPLSFVVAEKARFFQDHRAEELIMSSPDSSTHKRIGRGMRGLGPRSRRRRLCWLFFQVLTDPDLETAPYEHPHQKIG